jgi:hypothetical protein
MNPSMLEYPVHYLYETVLGAAPCNPETTILGCLGAALGLFFASILYNIQINCLRSEVDISIAISFSFRVRFLLFAQSESTIRKGTVGALFKFTLLLHTKQAYLTIIIFKFYLNSFSRLWCSLRYCNELWWIHSTWNCAESRSFDAN